MTESRIASRYAKSLIELSQEQGLLEIVKNDMADFAATCKSSRDLMMMLKNPIINEQKKDSAIRALFASSFNPLTIRFFELVVKKSRSELLTETASEFLKLYNQLKGIQEATLITSVEIDDNIKNQFLIIVQNISKKSNITLIHKINPSLIGGFILRVGDKQIDDSVSSQLVKLKTELTSLN
jgi:F-type H+-transporting ATPase subunit delta